MELSIRTGRSGDRISVGARFSGPVQTGPGAHQTSYTIGTGSFPGLEQPRSGVNHPPPSSAEVKERVVIPLLPLWAFMASSRANFTLCVCVCVYVYIRGVQLKSKTPTHWNLIGRSMTAPPPVLSPSSIFPLLSSSYYCSYFYCVKLCDLKFRKLENACGRFETAFIFVLLRLMTSMEFVVDFVGRYKEYYVMRYFISGCRDRQ